MSSAAAVRKGRQQRRALAARAARSGPRAIPPHIEEDHVAAFERMVHDVSLPDTSFYSTDTIVLGGMPPTGDAHSERTEMTMSTAPSIKASMIAAKRGDRYFVLTCARCLLAGIPLLAFIWSLLVVFIVFQLAERESGQRTGTSIAFMTPHCRRIRRNCSKFSRPAGSILTPARTLTLFLKH